MGNSDPILQLLKEFGYSVVRLPRESIRPLQVVEKQKDALTVLGELSDLFSGGAVPSGSRARPSGSIHQWEKKPSARYQCWPKFARWNCRFHDRKKTQT